MIGKDSEDALHLVQVFDKVKSHRIKCSHDDCESILLFYESSVEYPFYEVRLQFIAEPQFEALELTLGYVNLDFTRLELGLKYGFLVVSLLSFGALTWSVVKVPFSQVPVESNVALVFSVSLVLFNVFKINLKH